MPTLTLPVSAYLIGGAKPSQKYGMVTPAKLQQGAWDILLSASVAKIPRSATVTSAVLQIWGWGTFAGTVELAVKANTSAWTSSVTWSTLPSSGAIIATQTMTSPVPGVQWTFDVSAQAQAWVSGTATNYGLILASLSTTAINMRGTKDAAAPPVLVITYTLPPAAPTNLSPSSGAVASGTPVLTWDADDAVTQAQVQIADPPGTGTPEFDLTFSAVAGLLDLSTTSYAGIPDGAVKVWRVRQRNDQGWSSWSTWAMVARTSMPALSITSPASSTIEDGTPPVQWSLATGQQVAWRAQLVDVAGKVIADSGKTVGTATSWTPPRGLVSNGQQGLIKVWVWDDVDRASGPGQPVTMYAELAVTLVLSTTVTPVTTLQASQVYPSPVVYLSGTRSVGAPDEIVVFRDGVQIGRYAAADVFTGTNFSVTDATASMSTPTTYRVAAVANGKIAAGGPTSTITPTCAGIWLFDESDPSQAVVLVDANDQDQSTPEQSIEHVPISTDGQLEVVRRRMVRLPAQGSITGRVMDLGEIPASDSETALTTFATNDAGHVYRLVLGRRNWRCIIGNLDLSEQPIDVAGRRVIGVGFDWWGKARQGVS